ncbi:ISL3 family transposase, partial [Alkalispirochaeta americana]|uniref:ISL3 family transposase n=1 Tax=Alkalispirochaeta americana TaxID=159291 RepID=UPI001F37F96C
MELHPKHGWWGGCSRCGCTGCDYHDRTTRIVRDLPVFGQAVELRVVLRRVVCPVCGPSRESISWLDPYARVTTRMAETVCRMAEIMTVKEVAKTFLLAWHTVKNIHKRYLKHLLEPVDLNGVTQLLIDEFAIQKGHRYATVVVDALRKRVLWVGRGRSRASIRPFFELLGDQRRHIKAVALDMSSAYINEIAEQCPQAQVIFDHFHVIARYGREVIDRVRVDVANRYRHDPVQRKLVKGSRWLLLRNPSNISRPKDQQKLDELLEVNKELSLVYIMKEHLNHLWRFDDHIAARAWWHQWYRMALESNIDALIKFARNLSIHVEGLLAHTRYRLNTGVLEGMNNKIKVIKRVAYGFRDDEYF